MKHTTLSLAFYAVGGNDKAAELVGISTHWAKFLALTISGACAGLAGVIVSSDSMPPTRRLARSTCWTPSLPW